LSAGHVENRQALAEAENQIGIDSWVDDDTGELAEDFIPNRSDE
jgi:hypothetical protein